MSFTCKLNAVRNFLTSNCMFADEEWLSGCVEYLIENNGNNYNDKEIFNQAKEQWLLNNLTDICPGSLPANLGKQRKTVLNGRYVLQINAAMDIGTPAYQQYLKLQKVNTENIEATTNFEEKVPSHRMIKLYMTDGVQEISAMEYRPMRNLSVDITPGCKALIKGPVECRHGVILLTESSFELLGGEVEDLTVSNSKAGLLSSKLSLPMIQAPNTDVTIVPTRTSSTSAPHQQIPPPVIEEPTLEPIPDQTRPVARVTCVQMANFADDDDFDMAVFEAAFTDSITKRQMDDDILQPEKKMKLTPILRENDPDCYPDEGELQAIFDAEENGIWEDKALDPISSTSDQACGSKSVPPQKPSSPILVPLKKPIGPISLPSEPFVYIKQINDMDEIHRLGKVFKVKAQIVKLLSKLSIGSEGWTLKCLIIDGTGSIDVDFSNGVLQKLVGFTPQEFSEIKRHLATNLELKNKTLTAVRKASESLQVLYCIMEIMILETPTVIQLIDFQASHADLLRKRVHSTDLH